MAQPLLSFGGKVIVTLGIILLIIICARAAHEGYLGSTADSPVLPKVTFGTGCPIGRASLMCLVHEQADQSVTNVAVIIVSFLGLIVVMTVMANMLSWEWLDRKGVLDLSISMVTVAISARSSFYPFAFW